MKNSVESEKKLMILDVHNNLARVLCANSDFKESAKHYDIVLNQSQKNNVLLPYLSLGAAKAYFFAGDLEASIQRFQSALTYENVRIKTEVMVGLSQVLYALGSPAHIDLAKQQLFNW